MKHPFSDRTALIRNALQNALACLDQLPASGEANALRNVCCAWERVIGDWTSTAPTEREGELAMREIIALHVEIAKLRRAPP